MPWNVTTIGDKVFVSYAALGADGENPKAPSTGEEDHADHAGRVVEFDGNGNQVKVLDDKGSLDAPWGVTVAPAGFGKLTGDLLVANFGDGTISAFDADGTFVDYLRGADGKPLVNAGIWALLPGNGASLGAADAVYFTAGPNAERGRRLRSHQRQVGPLARRGRPSSTGGRSAGLSAGASGAAGRTRSGRWPALKASASEPMRVKRLAISMPWWRLTSRAVHNARMVPWITRGGESAMTRAAHPAALAELVAGHDLGDEPDLAGPLGRHALVGAEQRHPHDLLEGHLRAASGWARRRPSCRR